jgi:hypothetical protein
MMGWPRRIVLSVVLFAITSYGFPAGTALATNYCGEDDHGIWLIQKDPVGYGSWSEITKVNDTLNTCASGDKQFYASAVHTAGVAFSLNGLSWVEVGFIGRRR